MILRKALPSEKEEIWKILQQAIEQRKKDGSQQWQDGYPNENSIQEDLENNSAYVLEENKEIVAYASIFFGEEPAYTQIIGNWLTNGDYAVVHRLAVSKACKGKGIATFFMKKIEDFCLENHILSIKVDTNFDNIPMLKILEKLNYQYCGEVFFRGGSRKAFEKVLTK